MAPKIPLWLVDPLFDWSKDCPFTTQISSLSAEALKDPNRQQQRRSTAARQETPRTIHVPHRLKRILFHRKMKEEHAAALIQRNYRGYRERRQLSGLSLSPGDRWREAIKECEFVLLLLLISELFRVSYLRYWRY